MIFQIALSVLSKTSSIPPNSSTGWELFQKDLCSWPKHRWWFYRKVLVAFGVCTVCLFFNSHIKLLLVAGCNNLWKKQESHILSDHESCVSQNVFIMFKYFLWYFEIGIVCCGAITQHDVVIYWQNSGIALWKLCFYLFWFMF